MPAASLFPCPWIESPFFREMLDERSRDRSLDDEQRHLAAYYHEHGYVVLDDVADPETCRRIIEDVRPLFVPEIPDGPRSRSRVQDAWRESAAVRGLATSARVTSLLRLLYEREPFAFQTLDFLNGTQQVAHADTLHFNCVPAKYLCGVWVALEDIHPDSGPLFFYPGSHRLPELDASDWAGSGTSVERLYDELLRRITERFEREEFVPKRGQALVWAANLRHGGAPIRNASLTRRAQVTHYYFRECIYFFPMNSCRALGQFELKDVVDVATGRPVPPSLNGVPLTARPLEGKRSTLVATDAAVSAGSIAY